MQQQPEVETTPRPYATKRASSRQHRNWGHCTPRTAQCYSAPRTGPLAREHSPHPPRSAMLTPMWQSQPKPPVQSYCSLIHLSPLPTPAPAPARSPTYLALSACRVSRSASIRAMRAASRRFCLSPSSPPGPGLPPPLPTPGTGAASPAAPSPASLAPSAREATSGRRAAAAGAGAPARRRAPPPTTTRPAAQQLPPPPPPPASPRGARRATAAGATAAGRPTPKRAATTPPQPTKAAAGAITAPARPEAPPRLGGGGGWPPALMGRKTGGSVGRRPPHGTGRPMGAQGGPRGTQEIGSVDGEGAEGPPLQPWGSASATRSARGVTQWRRKRVEAATATAGQRAHRRSGRGVWAAALDATSAYLTATPRCKRRTPRHQAFSGERVSIPAQWREINLERVYLPQTQMIEVFATCHLISSSHGHVDP